MDEGCSMHDRDEKCIQDFGKPKGKRIWKT
jgi:hypothetical protein